MESIRLRKTGHYLKNAHQLAIVAKLAYDDDPGAASQALRTTFPEIVPFRRGETQGFVAANDKHVVLAFRGTDDPLDWIHNLQYTQVEGYGGWVHKGFSKLVGSVRQRFVDTVRSLRTDNQTVWVTGHSLGAAMATLAAWDLADRGIRPYATFTYGSPRVLNPEAAQKYRLRQYRFVNSEDVAPHFPMPGIWNRYTHIGNLTFLLKSGRIANSDRSWTIASRRVLRWMSGGEVNIGNGINDHYMDAYIKAIKGNC